MLKLTRVTVFLKIAKKQQTEKNIFDENFIYCILKRVKIAGSIYFFEYASGS
jgi:hypothetical protein